MASVECISCGRKAPLTEKVEEEITYNGYYECRGCWENREGGRDD